MVGGRDFATLTASSRQYTQKMIKPRVVFFHRKPYQTGNYSLEFIFSDLRRRLTNKIDSTVFESTYFSKGVLKRIYNTIEAVFNQGDVNFITGDIHYISLFLTKRKTILMIPDCGFLNDSKGLSRWIQKLLWLTIPVRRVSHITTISDYTKRVILQNVNIDPNKVLVIPINISEEYSFIPKQFNEKSPVLLQVGQSDNKNLTRIINAIKGLTVRLSIVGEISSHNQRLLRYNQINYDNAYNLSPQEMLQKYIDCDLLLFPSTYEGFGMPILEAQAVGRPVITSNVTSMPWVAGDAACLVDPLSVESIRAGIIKVIKCNDYRTDLIAKGLKNVKRFNPDIIANMYFDIIHISSINQ